MNQLAALKELAINIRDGDLAEKPDPQILATFISITIEQSRLLSKAYNSSLDAAYSLHKAVLGDRWEISIFEADPEWAVILEPLISRELKEPVHAANGSPARAWLLAIIKAKIQELE